MNAYDQSLGAYAATPEGHAAGFSLNPDGSVAVDLRLVAQSPQYQQITRAIERTTLRAIWPDDPWLT